MELASPRRAATWALGAAALALALSPEGGALGQENTGMRAVVDSTLACRPARVRLGASDRGPIKTRIAGKVVDAVTGDPLGGLVVRFEPGADLQALTDDDGHFTLPDLLPGTYAVGVAGPGYGRQSSCIVVPADQEVELLVALHPRPVAVAPLDVTVEGTRPLWLVRTGFYRRMRAGGGVFITEEDIRKQAPSRLSQMFRGRRAAGAWT